MSKLQNMRVIEIQKFRAVSSGLKTFDELFSEDGFDSYMTNNPHLVQPQVCDTPDLLWHEGDKNVWIYAIRDTVTAEDTAPYEVIEFPGGMYLVATADENDEDDLNETVDGMMQWIEKSDVFVYGDFPKSGMCNMPNGNGTIDQALGIAQQQIFLPLAFRQK